MRLTRLQTAVVGLQALALGIWTIAAVASIPTRVPSTRHVVLLALLVLLSQVATVSARHRADLFALAGGDAAIVVGLVLVGPRWVVTIAPLWLLAAHLLARRGWTVSLLQAAVFTIAAAAAAATAAGLRAVATDRPTLRDVGVLLVAASVFRCVGHLTMATAASVAQERPFRDAATAGLAATGQDWAAGLAVSAGFLLVLDSRAQTAIGLPLGLLALFVACRGYVSARQESALWKQLEVATSELNQLVESDVADGALHRACRLFGASGGELVLAGSPRRPPRVYSTTPTGDVSCRPGSGPRLASESAERAGKLAAGQAASVAAPLVGPTGEIGSLQLAFEAPVRFSARERHVLGTFAHAVATALLNAGLYDDVRTEASRQAHEASHDPLTGLANRALLQERTRVALAQPHNLTTALILLDLDHFKEINDTLGHAAGDFLLQQVAERLGSLSRPGDLVARLGGDEFAVLLTGLDSAAAASPAAERVLRLLTEPVHYEGLRLSVEGSLGVACYPVDAQDAEQLLRRAEVAMYQAKSDRGSSVRYDVERDGSSVHRLALVAELRSALERDEIVVHYQPQADLQTGEVVGVEALARWHHPLRGLLAPVEFIGVAEQSGLVRPFTLRVLDLAVAECARWAAAGRPVTVAVNLAARSLLDRQLPHDVAAVLARHSLPPDRLVLEITESTATSELEVVEEVLGRLRRLGVALSVDDFGTGYSSLAFLQRTAVNELKVDQSFVAGMLVNDNDLALVRTTVQLAHSLGARAVAEGVEDARLADALRCLGCDLAQGYWLSRPLPPEQLRILLGIEVLPAGRQAFAMPQPRSERALPGKHLRAVEG